MTYEDDYSIPEEALEQICSEGFDALPDLRDHYKPVQYTQRARLDCPLSLHKGFWDTNSQPISVRS